MIALRLLTQPILYERVSLILSTSKSGEVRALCVKMFLHRLKFHRRREGKENNEKNNITTMTSNIPMSFVNLLSKKFVKLSLSDSSGEAREKGRQLFKMVRNRSEIIIF